MSPNRGGDDVIKQYTLLHPLEFFLWLIFPQAILLFRPGRFGLFFEYGLGSFRLSFLGKHTHHT